MILIRIPDPARPRGPHPSKNSGLKIQILNTFPNLKNRSRP